MTYEVIALDGTIIHSSNRYDEMWSFLVGFKADQPNQNIDGVIVHNTVTKQWDYAWRIVYQLNDVKIN